MTKERELAAYDADERRSLAEAPGLRVRLLALGPDQCVPWHVHTRITDTFVVLDGSVCVRTCAPDAPADVARTVLAPGRMHEVTPGTPHHVTSADGAPCRFLVIQGVGEYDYVPYEAGVTPEPPC